MRNNKFETPLDLAALYGRLEVVKMLLNAHPNLLSCNTKKHTPLHLAARNGHRAVVQVLLDAGMDSNYQVAGPIDLPGSRDLVIWEKAQVPCCRAVLLFSTFCITCQMLPSIRWLILLWNFRDKLPSESVLFFFLGLKYNHYTLKRCDYGQALENRQFHYFSIHVFPLPPFSTSKIPSAWFCQQET